MHLSTCPYATRRDFKPREVVPTIFNFIVSRRGRNAVLIVVAE